MLYYPIEYSQPLYRPPSEANSLIFQVTHGCSWNRCTFCEMYTSKKYSRRDLGDILKEIKNAASFFPNVTKIFLADGDALSLRTDSLLSILGTIREFYPKVRRVSSYALPRNILRKNDSELAELKSAGLELIYLGIESGDDQLLQKVNKGETSKTTIEALLRFQKAGIKRSVMILNGLGGQTLSKNHAINSARVVNETQPEYLSTLVVTFPLGMNRFLQGFGPDYQDLDQRGLFQEIFDFLSECNLKNTIFRSDHASNYLILKGNLNRDKEKLLQQIKGALEKPELAGLRPEWMRGL